MKGQAPGVPRSLKAEGPVTAALDAFEKGGSVEPVLQAAQAVDAVSLWNLLARVDVAHAEAGTALEVGKLDGQQKRLPAVIVPLSHYDPKKSRPQS